MRFLEKLADGTERLGWAITTSLGAVAASINKLVATNSQGVLDPSLLNAGTSGANKVLMTGADGRVLPQVLPIGVGDDANGFLVAEALANGDLVNTYEDAGVAKVRKADAAANRPANGYVLAAYAVGTTATVYAERTNTQSSGLVPGRDVFLSTTPGKATTTAPAEPAMLQYVGYSVDATTFNFQRGTPTLRPAAA